MSGETRAAGASILLAVDGLFLGALLFIAVSVRRDHLARLENLGVGGPGWPDVGAGPGALLPWAAAGAAVLALLLCRVPPLPPLFALAGAIALVALALLRIEDTGATFGSGRYGTVTHVLAAIWIAHLMAAMAALGRGARPARFLALQAAYGGGLAALVFPA